MNGFVIRVNAYHGIPVVMNEAGVHARPSLSIDIPITFEKIINDITTTSIRDVENTGAGYESGYTLDVLIDDFEIEYACKVSADVEGKEDDGLRVFEFDVFEPVWGDDDEAKDVIDHLAERLKDWVEGYTAGR